MDIVILIVLLIVGIAFMVGYMTLIHAMIYFLRKLFRLPQRRDSFLAPRPGDYLWGHPDKPRERRPRRHRGLRI